MGSRPIGTGQKHSLPGIYAVLLARESKAATEPDPRLFAVADPVSRRRQIEKERAELAAHPERRQRKCVANLAALERGEPVLIPKWMVGGNSWPQARSWPEHRDPGVRMYRVSSDDTVVPVREFIDPRRGRLRESGCAAAEFEATDRPVTDDQPFRASGD